MCGVVVVVVDFGFFFLVTAERVLALLWSWRLNNLQQKQAGFSLSSFQRRGFCACCSTNGVPAFAA